MENKSLKRRVKLGSPVTIENAMKLRELSKRTLIPQSRLMDLALELLFKEYENK